MGTDLAFGICIGLPIWEIGKELHDKRELIRYDTRTGEQYLLETIVTQIKFNFAFGKYNMGDIVDYSEFIKYLQSVKNYGENSTDVFYNTNDKLINDDLIITDLVVGIYTLTEEEPYETPQDLYIEYDDKLDYQSKIKFTKLFGVKGRKLIYTRFSY